MLANVGTGRLVRIEGKINAAKYKKVSKENDDFRSGRVKVLNPIKHLWRADLNMSV